MNLSRGWRALRILRIAGEAVGPLDERVREVEKKVEQLLVEAKQASCPHNHVSLVSITSYPRDLQMFWRRVCDDCGKVINDYVSFSEKTKLEYEEALRIVKAYEETHAPPKRGRGRPRGSKNKK